MNCFFAATSKFSVMGMWHSAMATSSATLPFGGEIAEILMYAKPLSTDAMTIVSNYLNKKYGASY